MNKVAIIGYGHVGKSMHQLFPDALIYDPNIETYKNTQEQINKECSMAIICVWTGTNEDGSCDTSIVESSIKWLKTPLILIKSTIAPGTTDYLKKKYKKRICMSPEYFGEYSYWVPEEWKPAGWQYIIVGGDSDDVAQIMDYFVESNGPLKEYFSCTAIEAELIKYAENTFFATKVTFANELYDICKKFGANWYQVREGWVKDARVGKSHTAVFPRNRGYGGKCLPKDILALFTASEKKGYTPKLLKSVIEANSKIRQERNPLKK